MSVSWKAERSLIHHNARKRREQWCVVCRRSAVDEHSSRFHAAGGVLSGPFCSETCAFLWLRDDRVDDYPASDVRESYRYDKELEHFEQSSTAEDMIGSLIWPSISGH